MAQYVPFNCAAVIGAEDEFGRIYSIVLRGTQNSIKVAGGSTMVGVISRIPWEETVYAVGDNFHRAMTYL